jgi:hypothetical protein
VSQPALLRSQISEVGRIRWDFNWYALNNLKTVPFEAHDFPWIVGKKTHFLDMEGRKNLCANAVFTQIRFKTELLVGGHRVMSFVLKRIRLDLVDEANPTPFLAEVEQNTTLGLGDEKQRFVKLISAITADRPKHIPREALTVHANQCWKIRFDLPFHQGHMPLEDVLKRPAG